MTHSYAARLRRFPFHEELRWQATRLDSESFVVVSEHGFGWHGEASTDQIMETLVEFGAGRGGGLVHRPAVIEVNEPSLAAELEEALGPAEIRVQIEEELELVADYMEGSEESEPEFIWPTIDGVEPAAVHAFVESGNRYCAATPWRHVGAEDLIVVATPQLTFPYLLVTEGRLFAFANETDVEAVTHGMASLDDLTWWQVELQSRSNMPDAIGDYWTNQGLPFTDLQTYPHLARSADEDDGRTAEMLKEFQLTLAALSEVSADDWSRGLWRGEVSGGAIELRLPYLLSWLDESGRIALDDIADDQQSPSESALELVDNARLSAGSVSTRLAKEALALDAGCVPAYLVLAQEASDSATRRVRLKAAVTAGDVWRTRQTAPIDWEDPEAQVYLQARHALAAELADNGESAEAVEHFRALLDLDPDDSEAVAPALFAHLLTIEAHEEAERLRSTSPSTDGAVWAFGRALMAFRIGGDTEQSRELLEAAMTVSPFIVPVLGTRPDTPDQEAAFRMLSHSLTQARSLIERPSNASTMHIPDLKVPAELDAPRVVELIEQALAAHDALQDSWYSTPGAVAWIDRHGHSGAQTASPPVLSDVDALCRRGELRAARGDRTAALEDYGLALQIDAECHGALLSRADLHHDRADYPSSVADYERVTAIADDDIDAHNGLAWLLSTCPDAESRDATRAVKHAERAAELCDWTTWYCLGTLAAAHAEAGNFTEAQRWATASRTIAPTDELPGCEDRLQLYRAGQPCRDPAADAAGSDAETADEEASPA